MSEYRLVQNRFPSRRSRSMARRRAAIRFQPPENLGRQLDRMRSCYLAGSPVRRYPLANFRPIRCQFRRRKRWAGDQRNARHRRTRYGCSRRTVRGAPASARRGCGVPHAGWRAPVPVEGQTDRGCLDRARNGAYGHDVDALKQVEVHFDSGRRHHRLSVASAGAEAPLFHGFDGLLVKPQPQRARDADIPQPAVGIHLA